MHHQSHIGKLLVIWLILIALTAMTMLVGKVTSTFSIGILWMGLLMAVTWLKASLILGHYLELKSVKSSWYSGLNILVFAIVGIVFSIYAGFELYSR